jgi:hypothetical protein
VPVRRLRALLELLVKSGDRPVEQAAVCDELACQPHLQLLVAAPEPASYTFQMRGAAEHPQRHCERRIKRVQVPTQPLLGSPPPVDEIVAMVNQKLDLAVDPLVRPRPAQVRLAQRRPRDRERVDRVGLAACASGPRTPERHCPC